MLNQFVKGWSELDEIIDDLSDAGGSGKLHKILQSSASIPLL